MCVYGEECMDKKRNVCAIGRSLCVGGCGGVVQVKERNVWELENVLMRLQTNKVFIHFSSGQLWLPLNVTESLTLNSFGCCTIK